MQLYRFTALASLLMLACVTVISCYLAVQYQGMEQSLRTSATALTRMQSDAQTTQAQLAALQASVNDMQRHAAELHAENDRLHAASLALPAPQPYSQHFSTGWHSISVRAARAGEIY